MKTTKARNWQELVDLARKAPQQDEGVVKVPLGFATRVVAQAFAPAERGVASLFEPFALRALSLASLMAIAAVAANFSPVLQALGDEIAVVNGDPIAELLE